MIDLASTESVQDLDLGDDCTVRIVGDRIHPPTIPDGDRYVRRAALAAAGKRFPKSRATQIAYVKSLYAIAVPVIKGHPLPPTTPEIAEDVAAVVAGWRKDDERKDAALARWRAIQDAHEAAADAA